MFRYNNIGNRLKLFAKVIGWISIIGGGLILIIGLFMYFPNREDYEYAYAIAGYLSRYPNLQSAGNSAYAGLEMIKLAPAIIFGGYLGSWPLYGFGELIEKKI